MPIGEFTGHAGAGDRPTDGRSAKTRQTIGATRTVISRIDVRIDAVGINFRAQQLKYVDGAVRVPFVNVR